MRLTANAHTYQIGKCFVWTIILPGRCQRFTHPPAADDPLPVTYKHKHENPLPSLGSPCTLAGVSVDNWVECTKIRTGCYRIHGSANCAIGGCRNHSPRACDPCAWCRLKLTRRAPGLIPRTRVGASTSWMMASVTSPTGTSLLWVVFLFRTILAGLI